MSEFGAPDDDLAQIAQRCVDLLRELRATVATAESLTAGLVAATLADVPGASEVLRGGVVSYATDVKLSVLGVGPDVVEQAGVVSADCAREMAVGARALLGATWAVATTGVAGPAPQEGKPPGTVFVAVASESGARASELGLDGSRAEIRRRTVASALRLLIARLT